MDASFGTLTQTATPPGHIPDEIQLLIFTSVGPSLWPLPNEPLSGSTLSKTMTEPATAGTLSTLQAARNKPTLKPLVLMSTTAAVLDIASPVRSTYGDHYTAQDWNPVTYEEGMKTDVPVVAYRAGKKYAELEAWATVDPTSGHLRQVEL